MIIKMFAYVFKKLLQTRGSKARVVYCYYALVVPYHKLSNQSQLLIHIFYIIILVIIFTWMIPTIVRASFHFGNSKKPEYSLTLKFCVSEL